MFPVLLQASDDALDWPEAMIAVAGMVFIMSIAIVLIWQLASSWRARMSISREEAYRKIADENREGQQQVLQQQERMAADLASLNERVAGIEKLLKDVG